MSQVGGQNCPRTALGWRVSFPSGLSVCFRDNQLSSKERGRGCGKEEKRGTLEPRVISLSPSVQQSGGTNRHSILKCYVFRQPSPLKTQVASIILSLQTVQFSRDREPAASHTPRAQARVPSLLQHVLLKAPLLPSPGLMLG